MYIHVYDMGASEGDDSEDSFCEGAEQMFDQFHEYYMNILLRDYNANLKRYDIFKQLGMRERCKE